MGLQFENLILNNFTALLPKMGLSDKLFISAAPYRNARESKGGGCRCLMAFRREHALFMTVPSLLR